MIGIAFTLWVTVITFRYGSAVLRSLRSPFNLGNDLEWFIAWLTVAVVMVILAAAVKPAVRIVYAILAAACLAVLFLSGTLVSALLVSGLLCVSHLLGRRILNFLQVVAGGIAVTVPLGLIILALTGFVLASLHLLTRFSIWLAIPVLVAVSFLPRSLTRSPAAKRTGHFPEAVFSLPLLLIAPVILLNLIWAVAPEIQFDANNYHLAVSKIYLQNSGFIELPYVFHSYFYHLIEMLFTIALALQGAAAAKLLSFGFSLIALRAVFELGRFVLDENAGAWAAAFFYTTPIVSWLAGTAYIDNAVAMLLTATVIAFLKWQRSQEQTGWLYASSLLAGATVAAKMNGAFGLPVMAAIAVWQLRSRPRTLAICTGLVLAMIVPWYAVTYHWTGNPVFPVLNGFFQSPLWDLDNRLFNASDFGIGTSPGALARLPFRLIFETGGFAESSPRGAVGITLLFVLPFSLGLLSARKAAARILLPVVFIYLTLWAMSFQYVRFYVHILPLICVLGTAAVLHFSRQKWSGFIGRICLAIALVLQFTTTSIQFWNIPERFPTAVALGRETRNDFLTRALDGYPAVERLNQLLEPGDRVLGVAIEDLRFYLDAPLETLGDSTLKSDLRGAAELSGEKLRSTLRQSGFAYILVRRSALEAPPVWYPYLKPEFLGRFTNLVFDDGKAAVYRLKS